MGAELTMLAGSTVLCIALLAPRGAARLAMPGIRTMPDGWIGRAERAHATLLDSLVPFAICALAVTLTQKANLMSAMGAQLFFWAQAARAAIHLADIGWARLPAWMAGMVGLGLVVSALFQG